MLVSEKFKKFSFNVFRQDLEKSSGIRYTRGRKLADRVSDPDRGKQNSELRQHIVHDYIIYSNTI